MHFDHAEIADMLAERFFAEQQNPIPTRFSDDPETQPTRPFFPLSEEELHRQLKETSNVSAPGSSGIGWIILKKAWPIRSTNLTDITNACLTLGYQPARWKEATVVVIPKPDKSDYSAAKAHRPISLFETMSKLLEKTVAKHLQQTL